MKVQQFNIATQYKGISEEIEKAIKTVLESGVVINGKNVKEIEKKVAEYSGAKYGIGVANGSDALYIALKAIGIKEGDYVITTPFTYIATAGSIARAGGIPVFVDIEPDTYNMDPAKLEDYILSHCSLAGNQLIDRKTGLDIKAIIPVHLFGQMCEMEKIMDIANRYNIKVVEDCAQSTGAEYKGKRAGSFGDISTFSFYPTKNLAAYGDGGMITTSNPEYEKYCRVFSANGADPKYYNKIVGINSRLDELHAAMLNVKMMYLDTWVEDRFRVAHTYQTLFEEYDNLAHNIRLPVYNISDIKNHKEHTFNQYVIRAKDRDGLRKYLAKYEIATNIYYPLCLHLQKCFRYLGYATGDFPIAENASENVLALPMYPELTGRMQEYVVSKISQFYQLGRM